VQLDKTEATAPEISVATDADPREFLLKVGAWPADQPLRLTVVYSACVEEACHIVRQQYVVHLKRDIDGGGARGAGAGYWAPEDFAKQMLRGDKDKDGKLTREEVVGIALPHFEKLDVDADGLLDFEELKAIAEWLNHHHQPGAPTVSSKPSR
jgi:hypothetical protein